MGVLSLFSGVESNEPLFITLILLFAIRRLLLTKSQYKFACQSEVLNAFIFMVEIYVYDAPIVNVRVVCRVQVVMKL